MGSPSGRRGERDSGRGGLFIGLRRLFLGKRGSRRDSASSAFRNAGRLSPGSLVQEPIPFEDEPRA